MRRKKSGKKFGGLIWLRKLVFAGGVLVIAWLVYDYTIMDVERKKMSGDPHYKEALSWLGRLERAVHNGGWK